jgi:hypothetical protein
LERSEPPVVLIAFRRLPFGDHEFDDGSIQRLVICVCKDDLNLVRSCRKTDEDNGLATAVSPVLRRGIQVDIAFYSAS